MKIANQFAPYANITPDTVRARVITKARIDALDNYLSRQTTLE